jgi:hypothetical protein
MRDPTGSSIHGKTRWRRAWVLLTPAFGVVALMMYLTASGVLALNLAISGMPFKLSATTLSGSNFIQFAAPTEVTNPAAGLLVNGELATNSITTPGSSSQVNTLNGNTYLADTITLMQGASIVGLHQTVCAPLAPAFLGFSIPDLQVTIDASGTATADHLTVQAPALKATSATFTNIVIGQDTAGALSDFGYPAISGTAGLFSQAADSVSISGLTQIAVGTEAGTFTLPGLTISASFVGSCP